MKRIAVVLFASLLLAGCSEEKTNVAPTDSTTKESVSTDNKENGSEQTSTKASNTTTKSEDKINTAVFQGAQKVEVTDAIKTKKLVTVVVYMNKNAGAGPATSNVINQTYDFLQQKKLEGAKKVTITIIKDKDKVAQFTVDTEKFNPKDGKWASASVLSASKIDFMTKKVKEFGAALGSW